MTLGTSALVARSLSASANVCGGAEALFPGQGKQIVGPFANEKRERGEKRRRAGSAERCLAWQGDRDYTSMTFSSTKRKWRGSTGEEKLNPCTWGKFTISWPVSNTAHCWCLQDVVTGCWLGTSAAIYWKVIQQQEEGEKKREKACMARPEEKVKGKQKERKGSKKKETRFEYRGESRMEKQREEGKQKPEKLNRKIQKERH